MQESAAHRVSMPVEKRKVCGIEVHKSFLVATILDCEGNSKTRRVHQYPPVFRIIGLIREIRVDNSWHYQEDGVFGSLVQSGF